MLRLLIIEDEKWEREGLMDFVDWNNLGIELSDAACDGIEGIEKARAIRPDIIITDIKMPGMDGLKMSRIIREFLPDVKIIILTGYDDFKLAREAINISANAYILKPVDGDELIEALEKVINECKNDAADKEKDEILRKLLDESIISARRKLLAALLKEKPSEELLRNIAGLGVLPDAGYAAVIAAGLYEGNEAEPGAAGIFVDLDGLDNTLKTELINAGLNSPSASCESDAALFILGVPENMQESCLRRAAEIICSFYEKKGVKAAVGIGMAVGEAAELHCSNRQAREALDFALFWKDCRIAEYSAIETLQQDNAAKVGDFLAKGNDYTRRLMNMLRGAAESAGINSLLDDMFRFIESNKWLDKNMVVNFLYGQLNETSLLFHDINMPGRDEGTAGDLLPDLPDFRSLKEHVRFFFEKASEAVTDKKRNRDAYIVKKVEQIIKERYNSDISLKTIAAEIYLSPNYLGSIFKKHTGTTLNDYLCRLRMEKAKELLRSPKNKVSRVAKDVGMPNVSYFCHVFREMFGIAPGEYQEMIIHGN